jgi:PAS domain S-box-containing protein
LITKGLQLPQQIDAEQPLGAILKTALDAVIIMDSDGRIIGWNDVASGLFGWTPAEAVGAILAELIIPPAFRMHHEKGLRHFMATGDGPLLRRRIEVSALRRSGEEFPVELSISPYVDGGQLVFLGFIRDITERKEAARALERRARQATILYEAVSATAGAASVEEAIRMCLKAVHELTGWPTGHVYISSANNPDELVPSNIWYPADETLFRNLYEVTAQTRFSLGRGLPGSVWKAGEPVWISDIHTDERFPRASQITDLGIRSALGFPIKNAGSVIAVVEVFTPVQSEPDRDLLLTLRTIGDQVGRVFERRLSEAELKKQMEHQKLLLAELNHRVKNMLAVVSGIASQTARNSNSIEGFTKNFLERIDALSRAHSMLTAQNWKATSLETIAEQVFAPYSDSSAKFNISGAVVNLMPKEALAVSLVLHEMVTNAAKYGALTKEAGRISVKWRLDPDSHVRLTWSESGVSALAPPIKTGFGTKLINATIKHELQGELAAQYGSDGISYDFRWPHSPTVF